MRESIVFDKVEEMKCQLTAQSAEFVNQAPVVQRADNFIYWIGRYAACARISL